MNRILLCGYFLFCCISFTKAQEIKKILIKAYTSQDSSDYYFKIAKKNIKSTADEAEYYFCKNARCGDYSQPDSAIYYGEKAIGMFQKTEGKDALLTLYNNMSKVYRKNGQYDKAISYSLDGLKLAEANKKDNWIAFFNTNLSLTYHDFESYKKGVYYGKKALNIWLANKKTSPQYISNTLNAIAINYDDWKKPDSALYYHKKVFKYIKGKDTLNISDTYNNIGNTLLKQKKYKEAQKWIATSLKICDVNFVNGNETKDFNYYYERATCYTNLATIAYQLDDFTKAEKLFKTAYEYAKKSNSAEKLRDYYFQKAEFEKKRNNLEKTVEEQENYIKLRDSVFDVEREQRFSELEAKYQNEKKEKLLLKSKTKILEKENEIRKKNIQFIILTGIILGILIVSYLVYYRQKLKNKQQQQEFELKSAITKIETQNKLQEQRLQISRDLHDNIGSQLTFIISSVDNIKYAFDLQNAKLDTKLSTISTFAKSTIIELRDTIWAMNKSEISFEDLQTRIHNFIDKAKEAKEEIQFRFEIDPDLKNITFTSLEGMNIYRTIQEGINNSIKYAEASQILIKIVPDAHAIKILVEDNGKGFNIENIELGNGIANMKKRIADVGGTFEIHAAMDAGTSIAITLPNRKG
ncbi:tetratricopeptide repeat-containing sensor histidine kinase [Flavobacterium phycosphaerae]|uniref:tetratricopeptide repeat-containing sensor histidine kinase n=1 Tax=Flavobacterium phycosphaerae TaxID=2697515 RepID=UPI001389C41C|nr:tetratricopeptide repeat protein [Flavobacterium phycosphaerae]